MRRILEQCMVKLQLKIDYNYRGKNLEFGHVLARCTQHMDTAAMYIVRTLNASGRCGFSVD